MNHVGAEESQLAAHTSTSLYQQMHKHIDWMCGCGYRMHFIAFGAEWVSDAQAKQSLSQAVYV